MPSANEPGFGVYVHWPFCLQKCPYCDFNSHVRHVAIDEDRFANAFVREIETTATLTGARDVSSIFLGGGTPSLMKPSTVERIIESIGRVWRLMPDAEITLEANPSSVEAERFRGYRAAGVNRVSLGVQSLRDEDLKKLGRLHNAREALEAIETARGTFNRFSFDLIYARPAQTLAEWQTELDQALSIGSDHLSLYQLTIEPGTPFARLHDAGKLTPPPAQQAFDLYALTGDLTSAAGLACYETSNYARPGQESRHNLIYWRYGEYAGVGPGAHGRIVSKSHRYATSTELQPERWLSTVEADGHGRVETAALSRAEQADEMLLMGLRLAEGVNLDRLAAEFGVQPSEAVISRLCNLGMVELTGSSEVALGDFDCITACIGPGQVPASQPYEAPSRYLRAVGEGRFVLNALIAELAAGLETVPQSASSVDDVNRGRVKISGHAGIA